MGSLQRWSLGLTLAAALVSGTVAPSIALAQQGGSQGGQQSGQETGQQGGQPNSQGGQQGGQGNQQGGQGGQQGGQGGQTGTQGGQTGTQGGQQGGQAGQFTRTTVPLANCSVDPNQTADPRAVSMAQKAIADFLNDVNRTYSIEGFATAAADIASEGNAQSEWYNQTLALACGRLTGGYQGMNWVTGMGWQNAR